MSFRRIYKSRRRRGGLQTTHVERQAQRLLLSACSLVRRADLEYDDVELGAYCISSLNLKAGIVAEFSKLDRGLTLSN